MKHDSDGQHRLTRVRLCALAVLLLPLLAACAGSSAPPAAGTAPAATTVAGTTSVPQATAAGTAVAATSAAGGTAGAVTATAGSATESVATATTSSATVSAATATAAETTPATTTTAGSTAQAGAAPAAGLAPPDQQVLRIAWAEPKTLDPLTIHAANDVAIAEQLFTGPTRLGPDLTPQPAVAESWQFNPDHTQITFKLRDTQWSDGKPVTAQDFAYAWRRVVDPQSTAPGTSLTGGTIKGEQALSTTPLTDTARLQQARANFGVTALDAKTLQVTFEHPAPFFPSLATNLFPVRQDVVEQYGAKWTAPGHLVGNGPFVLKSWTKGSELTLAPNPHSYAAPPRLTALTFKFFADPATCLPNYQAGQVDECLPSPQQADVLRADPQLKDQVLDLPALGTASLDWNMTKPPFDNLKVRQAFAAAVDRQTIAQQALHGVGTPAYSFIPPGMPGHLTEAEAGPVQRYDPARAKQLLAEAGYPGGHGFPALTLLYLDASPYAVIVQRAAADLQRALGITITLKPGGKTPGQYFGSLSPASPPDFFYEGARFGALLDPNLPHVGFFGPGQDPGRWQNAEFSRLIAQADQATDPGQRLALSKQAEQILARDAARVFVLWFGTFGLIKPYVKGLTYTSRDYLPGESTLKDAYILKH